ncbi:MAG: FliH/SctL family protein [Rhodospirillales bacterium]
MATRVLTGDAARPIEPVPWKTVAPAGSPKPAAEPARDDDRAAAQAEIASLKARIAQLEQETQQREQQAFAAGYRKGESDGREQAAASLNPVIEQFVRTVAELSQMRRRLRREAEQDVVKLALAIGRRIVHREMSIDPEAILGVVKAALTKLEGREVDCVRVSPEDAEIVRRHLDQMGRPGRIEVIGDNRLGRGSAVFETPRGNLDVSVETQLEEIQRGLADRLRH